MISRIYALELTSAHKLDHPRKGDGEDKNKRERTRMSTIVEVDRQLRVLRTGER
jgi:hypothetical protein